MFQLIDWYSSAFALLLGSALEGIVVCWIYGKYTVAPWADPEWGRGSRPPGRSQVAMFSLEILARTREAIGPAGPNCFSKMVRKALCEIYIDD